MLMYRRSNKDDDDASGMDLYGAELQQVAVRFVLGTIASNAPRKLVSILIGPQQEDTQVKG